MLHALVLACYALTVIYRIELHSTNLWWLIKA